MPTVIRLKNGEHGCLLLQLHFEMRHIPNCIHVTKTLGHFLCHIRFSQQESRLLRILE